MPISQAAAVLQQLNRVLGTRFAIGHATIQVECPGCDLDALYCILTPEADDQHGAQYAGPATSLAGHERHR